MKPSVASFLSDTKRLHLAFIRREGSVDETRRQALFLLGEHWQDMADSKLDSQQIGEFAVQATALYFQGSKLRAPRDQLLGLHPCFTEALVNDEVRSSRWALSRVAEFAATISASDAAADVANDSFEAVLRQAYTHGAAAAIADKESLHVDAKPPASFVGDIERLLFASSQLYSPDFKFREHHGVGAAALLSRKTKVDMQAKMQRCANASKLMGTLRNTPLTQIDALRLLTKTAKLGFFNEEVIRNCCDTITRKLDGFQPRDIARATNALGTLGFRPAAQPIWCKHLTGKKLPADMHHALLTGLAMNQFPLDSVHAEKIIGDGLWLHGRRTSDVGWLVDMLHASSVVGFRPQKFVVHSCRGLLTKIFGMSDLQLLKLLFVVGSPESWDVDPEFVDGWRKVDRVRDILVMKIAERNVAKGSSDLALIVPSALAAAGAK